uniref:Uncharacterized protein n=1 Tax=Tetranychus urticae TaxID=32264 RepID=T1L4S5_TETUR
MDDRAIYKFVSRYANEHIMSLWIRGGINTPEQHIHHRIVLEYCKTLIKLCETRELAYRAKDQGNRALEKRFLNNTRYLYEYLIDYMAHHKDHKLPIFPSRMCSEFFDAENIDPCETPTYKPNEALLDQPYLYNLAPDRPPAWLILRESPTSENMHELLFPPIIIEDCIWLNIAKYASAAHIVNQNAPIASSTATAREGNRPQKDNDSVSKFSNQRPGEYLYSCLNDLLRLGPENDKKKNVSLFVNCNYPSCTLKSVAIAGHYHSRKGGAKWIYATNVKLIQEKLKMEGAKSLDEIKKDVLHLCKDMRLLTFDSKDEAFTSLQITPNDLLINDIEHVNAKSLFGNVPLERLIRFYLPKTKGLKDSKPDEIIPESALIARYVIRLYRSAIL